MKGLLGMHMYLSWISWYIIDADEQLRKTSNIYSVSCLLVCIYSILRAS